MYPITATEAERNLVVDALRQAAETRTRAARRATADVEELRLAGKDVRSAAVKIVGVLGEAGVLDRVAEELATAADVTIAAEPTKPTKATTRRRRAAKPPQPAPEPITPATQAPTDIAQPPAGHDPEPVNLDELADQAGLKETIIDEGGHTIDGDTPVDVDAPDDATADDVDDVLAREGIGAQA